MEQVEDTHQSIPPLPTNIPSNKNHSNDSLGKWIVWFLYERNNELINKEIPEKQ